MITGEEYRRTHPWVAYFELSDGIRRYLRMSGTAMHRGMYRNRRAVGIAKAEWTTDVALARRFRSPSEAKRSPYTFHPARPESIRFEKLPG